MSLPEIESAGCGCEYPCSCLKYNGTVYESYDDLVLALAEQIEEMELEAEKCTGPLPNHD